MWWAHVHTCGIMEWERCYNAEIRAAGELRITTLGEMRLGMVRMMLVHMYMVQMYVCVF